MPCLWWSRSELRVSVKMRHDLIVVGAGTAGCMAAKTAAEGGLGVLLIDSKPRDEIGDTACGNVVSAGDLDRVGIRHPKDICRVLKGVKVFSPDRKTVFTINLKHFVLNRRAFGQRLLSDAKRAGVEFSDRTKALAERAMKCPTDKTSIALLVLAVIAIAAQIPFRFNR